jgi:SAM-dependent methyltransferase
MTTSDGGLRRRADPRVERAADLTYWEGRIRDGLAIAADGIGEILSSAKADVGQEWTDLLVRVQLTPESAEKFITVHQRRRQALDMRTQGDSLRAIAGALEVSPRTVQRDLSGVASDATPEPDRTVGVDGKSYPRARPARTTVPKKPDLGGGVSHPARYSSALFPVFTELLEGFHRVLDPFAGTGRIHDLAGHETVGVEIEPEWAAMHHGTIVGNARALPFGDASFAAICTSPTFANRLSDHHNASDPERRRSYAHDLGRPLSPDNSGALPWGDDYRRFHRAAWAEVVRVLAPGGRFVLNIKDHIRGGEWQDVSAWHVRALLTLGLELVAVRPVVTPHLRQGANTEVRVGAEMVVAFTKAVSTTEREALSGNARIKPQERRRRRGAEGRLPSEMIVTTPST